MQSKHVGFLMLLGLGLAAGSWLIAAAESPAVTYIGHDKVAESLAKGGNLVTATDLIVLGAHRAGPGQVEVHEKETARRATWRRAMWWSSRRGSRTGLRKFRRPSAITS